MTPGGTAHRDRWPGTLPTSLGSPVATIRGLTSLRLRACAVCGGEGEGVLALELGCSHRVRREGAAPPSPSPCMGRVHSPSSQSRDG